MISKLNNSILSASMQLLKNNEENSNRFLSKLQSITEEIDEQTSDLSEEEEADELHDERIIEASEELLYLENMYYQFALDYCKKLKILLMSCRWGSETRTRPKSFRDSCTDHYTNPQYYILIYITINYSI